MIKKFIVSCENSQELDDLRRLSAELEGRGYKAQYFDIAPMLGSPSLVSQSKFSTTFSGFGLSRQFKKLSVLAKLFIATINALLLVSVYYKSRSRFVLIGTPLLVYRVARIITFGHLKTVSLIRGVIAHSEASTSVSSRVFMKFGFLARSRALKSLLSDYDSSLVLCTGAVTRDFLFSRGVSKENIDVVGSVYCDSLDMSKSQKATVEPVMVFVSSSFAFHGYDDAQSRQTELIAKLKAVAERNGIKFIVRKHPRESIEFYNGESGLQGCIDDSISDPISSYPENTLFISTASTLIFEMAYAGRNASFVADDFFARRFAAWYSAVGMDPCRDLDRLASLYRQGERCNVGGDLARVLELKYKGRVVSQSVTKILEKIEGYDVK